MRPYRGDIILQPGAGEWVHVTFAHARSLCWLLGHDVIVEGNEVRVVVTPEMEESECQGAYERALDRRSAGRDRAQEREGDDQ